MVRQTPYHKVEIIFRFSAAPSGASADDRVETFTTSNQKMIQDLMNLIRVVQSLTRSTLNLVLPGDDQA